ncbi:MAG: hypothetical protein ACSLE6_13435 [Mycobacterium sp.]
MGSGNQRTAAFEDLTFPTSIALDEAGNIYVVDKVDNRVLRLDAESNEQTELTFDDDVDIFEMAVSPAGDVYVANSIDTVLVIPAGEEDSEEIDTDSLPSDSSSLLVDSIATDPDNNLWVIDGIGEEIITIDSNGSDWSTVGETPADCFVSSLTVADDQNAYASVYDSDAEEHNLSHWTGDDNWDTLPDSEIANVGGIAVDAEGAVYITDARSDRVGEMQPKGALDCALERRTWPEDRRSSQKQKKTGADPQADASCVSSLDRRVRRRRVLAAQRPGKPGKEVFDLVADVIVRIRIHVTTSLESSGLRWFPTILLPTFEGLDPEVDCPTS